MGKGKGKGQQSHFRNLNADFSFIVLVASFSRGKNHQQVHAHGAELVLEMPSSLRHSPH